MYHRGLYFDPTMIILLPAIIISLYAQIKVKSTYSKYSRINNMNGLTGFQVARLMLDEAGLSYIPVEMISGELTDHYDPRSKVLRLSRKVYSDSSIASVGVAAHEVGHAIQHAEEYAPIKIRNAIVPAVNFGSSFSMILFIAGLVLSATPLIDLGILLFSATVIFQLVTLPVEFNASHRAMEIIKRRNFLFDKEVSGAGKVLRSAALTYIASALMAILQLVRLIAIRNDRN